jgi:hypothetical protein
VRRLLVLLLAVLGCWLGLVSAASAYAATASDVSAFSYNAPSSDAPENRAAPERGPPSTDPVNTTYVAVDLRSPGTSARQGGPGSRAIYAYDGTALRVQGGTVAGTTTIRPVNARSGDLSSFEQWRVAAEAGADLIPVAVNDPAAKALAERLGGQASVRFAGDATGREFDAVSELYVAQTKPAGFQLGSAFRNQAKATFEAALNTGRTPYFHFEGEPGAGVINKLLEYGNRYGIDPVIDTVPFGG